MRAKMSTLALLACLATSRVAALQPPTASSCDEEPMRATGTTYYVCECESGAHPDCVPGDDSSDGTSPARPWRSFAKAFARFKIMDGGSTVAFCRGGAWNHLTNQGPVRNTKCRVDDDSRPPRAGDVRTCDMRDYTPAWGATAKPTLSFARGTTFLGMGWYEEKGPSGWSTPPIRGFRILNLDVVGAEGTVQGVYLWGKVEGLEICGNNFRDGFTNAYVGVTTMTVRYVNFHHNRITNNPYGIGQIVGTSCLQDCWFDSNYMDLNGGPTNRDHSIYAGGSPYGGPNWPTSVVGANPGICQGTSRGFPACFVVSRGIRITNNEIRRSAWGPSGTRCNASAIVVHSPHDGLVIENNLIFEPVPGANGCYGIDHTAGIDMPGAWTRTVIRRNQIFNVGGNGITVGNCKECIVEDNIVHGGAQGIQYPDPGNRCRPGDPGPGMAEYTCSGNVPDAGGVVRNNTVVNAGVVSVNRLNGAGSGWVAANNAVCGNGAAVKAGSGTTLGGNLVAPSCSGWFEHLAGDPAIANFTPAPRSSLNGSGSKISVGSRFIGAQPWSATDAGLPPDAPPTVGAVRR